MMREEGIHLDFSYAAGEAASLSHDALADGRLVGSRCDPCDRVAFPRIGICPACGNDSVEMTPIEPRGVVAAVTEVPGKGWYALIRLGETGALTIQRLLDPAAPGDEVEPAFGTDPPLAGFKLKEDDR